MSIWQEIKRRNVVRVAATYAIVAWLLLQIAALVIPALSLPEWGVPMVTVLVLLGFPVALVLAWAFELTPSGIRRTGTADPSADVRARGVDLALVVLLALGIGIIAFEAFNLGMNRSASTTDSAEQVHGLSIAVLPFADMTGDESQEYFAEGISEELLNILANLPDVRVPSRTSSFAFKNSEATLREIGDALDVDYVLDGSVRKDGGQIRINSQLVEVDTDSNLWSRSFDRPLINVFEIQNEIATSVAAALQIELLGGTVLDSAGTGTTNLEAHDAFLQGLALIQERNLESLRRADDHFQRAIEIDPEYAAAYGALAINYFALASYGGMSAEESRSRGFAAIDRALEIDPNVPEAFAARGLFLSAARDYVGARLAFDRATDIRPNYADAWSWKSIFLPHDRIDVAVEMSGRAVSLDPRSPQLLVIAGAMAGWQGRLDDSKALYEEALTIEPGFANAYQNLSGLELVHGRLAEHLRIAAMAASDEAGRVRLAVRLGVIYSNLGDTERAVPWLRRAAEMTPNVSTAVTLRGYSRLIENGAKGAEVADFVAETMASPLAAFTFDLWHLAGLTAPPDMLLERLSETNPVLAGSSNPRIGFNGVEPAIRAAFVLRRAGEAERSELIARRVAALLAQVPDNATLGGGANYSASAAILRARLSAIEDDAEVALARLTAAIDAGFWPGWWPGQRDPYFEILHDDPDYQALEARIESGIRAEHEEIVELEEDGAFLVDTNAQ
jgi:TolB-like protein/Flp pilus assembly protein TadD